MFIYKLSGCGFKSSCSHLNFKFRACFEQGVPWHSDNYRVWIHSEMRTWHDKNIQFKFCLRLVLAFDSAYFLPYAFYSTMLWLVCFSLLLISISLLLFYSLLIFIDKSSAHLKWPLEHVLFCHLVRIFQSKLWKDSLLILLKFKRINKSSDPGEEEINWFAETG